MLPQIKAKTAPEGLITLVKTLLIERDDPNCTPGEKETYGRLATDLLSHAVGKVDFTKFSTFVTNEHGCLGIIQLYVDACLQVGDETLAQEIIKKVVSGPCPESSHNKKFLSDVGPVLDRLVARWPATSSATDPLRETVSKFALDKLQARNGTLTEGDIISVVDLAVRAGGTDMLENT